jgi:dTMP kinase
MRGKFIVIDGMDGSGKGTQLALLRGALKDSPVHYTREPGGNGSDTAEFLRRVILEPSSFSIAPHPLCDFFLFWASRAQHVEEVVEPKRSAGFNVISDRYCTSTWAFQVWGENRQDWKSLFNAVLHSMSDAYFPDLYLFLDLPAEAAFERRKNDAAQEKTRFDLKPLDYHERVREGFRTFHELIPDQASSVRIIDANRSKKAVHQDVVAAIKSALR